ncbi:50S ribosomal protein L35ae [Candidatus Woesearchaeota archaeon]|nr:50S ribosomal protein L35ae [Candidatus Woesearchaeota archaeon]
MAVIAAFRGSHRVKRGNHMVIHLDGVDSREKAMKSVGKSVVWTSPGKEKKQIKGKITSAHGNSGAVRAIFERGLPGQSLGEEVKVE